MTSSTSAGTKLAISAGIPASQTSAGYDALTFTTVKGVQSVGGFGAETGVNRFQPLDGPEEKHKGPVSYGALTPPIAVDRADAGQNLVKAAAAPGNNNLYAFRVTKPNGDIRYFQARVFSWRETIGEATTIVMVTPSIEINTEVIEKDAA